jgi:hypothetical protein
MNQHHQDRPGYCQGYHESVAQYLDRAADRITVPTSVPKLTRRDVLRMGGLTVGSYFLLPCLSPRNVQASQAVKPRGSAENVIMIFLHGGASQLDTFDFKEGSWTPADFEAKTIHENLRMPAGLHPKLAERHQKYAIVRSMNFWEAEHTRGTYYVQAGRILSPARTHEIPSIGSIVALETAGQRRDSDFLPPFVAINMSPTDMVGPGMLDTANAPMGVQSDKSPPFIMADGERKTYETRRQLLDELDSGWRKDGDNRGRILQDIEAYYQSAYPMLDNSKAGKVFKIDPDEQKRYGKSKMGDAMLLSRNLVEADSGTKFILIDAGGWDLHQNAYVKTPGGQYQLCWDLDNGLASLLDDLEAKTDKDGHRLIDKTFIMVVGEFGRTPGPLNHHKGRDHHRFSGFSLFAGAGVQGGKILGATDDQGGTVSDFGWHRSRPIYPEDTIATLYSAMGIDWTKKITNTPSGRAFEYIENISPKGPMMFDQINELFA